MSVGCEDEETNVQERLASLLSGKVLLQKKGVASHNLLTTPKFIPITSAIVHWQHLFAKTATAEPTTEPKPGGIIQRFVCKRRVC